MVTEVGAVGVFLLVEGGGEDEDVEDVGEEERGESVPVTFPWML